MCCTATGGGSNPAPGQLHVVDFLTAKLAQNFVCLVPSSLSKNFDWHPTKMATVWALPGIIL